MVSDLQANFEVVAQQATLCANCLRDLVTQPDRLLVPQTYFGKISQTVRSTAEKVTNFLYAHKEEIFFGVCTAASIYFAPQLFFPAAIITIILRVEIKHFLKSYANEYLKDEKNPYQLHPYYGPKYVSSLNLSMGTIAAIDAIAIGTVFTAGSWSIAALPILGGIAAGSVIAKIGMDLGHRWL